MATRSSFKRIEAVIRPEYLEPLRHQLDDVGYPGMMATEIKGHGKQGGITQQWRGTVYQNHFVSKVRVEIVVPAHKLKALIAVIVEVCASGRVGDGKIFVCDVEQVIRIRTGERGLKALS